MTTETIASLAFYLIIVGLIIWLIISEERERKAYNQAVKVSNKKIALLKQYITDPHTIPSWVNSDEELHAHLNDIAGKD